MWKRLSLQLSDIGRAQYPVNLLKDCQSGLCLFGAGFYGGSDAIHMYDTGLSHVNVVDIDRAKINVMQNIYPSSWVFSVDDVFEWVRTIVKLRLVTWDIVSIDPPTALIDRCLDELVIFSALAKKYVTLTTYPDHIPKLEEEYRVIDITDRSRVARTVVVALAVEGRF